MTLAVINGNNQQQMRGVARVQGDVPENADLKTLVGNGYLVITISPEEGERYQGVVGLEGDTLAACLEDYFMRSEQLPTRLSSSAPVKWTVSLLRAVCCCRFCLRRTHRPMTLSTWQR